jgi:uncharacterized protein with HEPN domain
MTKKNDRFYIHYILEAIQRMETYTLEGKDKFFQSTLIQDAIIRNLEVIGEASKSVSNEFREKYSEVPWRNMTGLRDVLIHEYFRINLDIVWNVAAVELPKVKEKLQTVV